MSPVKKFKRYLETLKRKVVLRKQLKKLELFKELGGDSRKYQGNGRSEQTSVYQTSGDELGGTCSILIVRVNLGEEGNMG